MASRPSRVRTAGSSVAVFQDSGISISVKAVAPASMAFQLASTMAWPFLAYECSAASFMYLMASSCGSTPDSVKNADWRMVLVRLPMPTCMARSMALIR